MSGGMSADGDTPVPCTVDGGDGTTQQLDHEMKEDSPSGAVLSACGTAAIAGAASNGAGSRRGSGTETTWSFVQMNMTLLPIARPLPVNISNRIHEGLSGRKPRTPNQKLHHRVLRNASNISPRHHEDNMLRRRGSTSSESGAAAYIIPRQTIAERQVSAPISIPSRTGKRKSEFEDHYLSSSWQSGSMFHRPHVRDTDDESRGRSFSEDLATPDGSGFDSSDSQLEGFVLSRSASTSSAFAQRGALFKDKRILEIQDEERRLLPDERATLPSPSKRSRHK